MIEANRSEPRRTREPWRTSVQALFALPLSLFIGFASIGAEGELPPAEDDYVVDERSNPAEPLGEGFRNLFDHLQRVPVAMESDVPLGSTVDSIAFLDRHFLWRDLNDLGDRKATVILVTSPECPVAKRVVPEVVSLEREYRERGVAFLAIDPTPGDVLEAVAQGLDARAEFPFAKDPGGVATAALGATHTPTACLLDSEGRLVYRGRVDGRIRTTGSTPSGRQQLREAIEDVLAGREVREPSTTLEGCPITRLEVQAPDELTWTNGVGELIRNRCGSCHRPGGLSPFTLWSHDQVVRRASSIAEVVSDQRMPPWFAVERDPELGAATHSNRRALTTNERDGLLAWIAAGAPRGGLDPDPPTPAPSGWHIGEPDLVLTGPSTSLPASGVLDYRYLRIDHVFEHDTWIEGIEVRGSAPGAQHHMQVKHIDADVKVTDDLLWTKSGRLMGVFVPGRRFEIYEPGTALFVPAGSALALEIHYVTTGRAAVDTPRIGLRFPRTPVKQRVNHYLDYDWNFEVPAGDRSFVLEFSRLRNRPTKMVVRSVLPHMHLRGKSFEIWAEEPGAAEQLLVQIPAWNFDWQYAYRFEPGTLVFSEEARFGARVEFDNSSYNPFNPDEGRSIRPGQETEDEMAIFWITYTDPDEVLHIPVDSESGRGLVEFTPRRVPRASKEATTE